MMRLKFVLKGHISFMNWSVERVLKLIEMLFLSLLVVSVVVLFVCVFGVSFVVFIFQIYIF